MYFESKLLMLVVYFAEPIKTSLWAIWADQYAQNTWFLLKASQEGNEWMYHYIREAKSLLFKSIYSAHMPQVNMTSFFDRLWTYTGKKA